MVCAGEHAAYTGLIAGHLHLNILVYKWFIFTRHINRMNSCFRR